MFASPHVLRRQAKHLMGWFHVHCRPTETSLPLGDLHAMVCRLLSVSSAALVISVTYVVMQCYFC